MRRRTISLRVEQDEWIDEQGIDLSAFVRERIEEAMADDQSGANGRTDVTTDELAKAYRENAADARETGREWRGRR